MDDWKFGQWCDLERNICQERAGCSGCWLWVRWDRELSDAQEKLAQIEKEKNKGENQNGPALI